MRQTVLRKEEPCTAHEDPLLGRGEEARVCTMRLPICQNQVLEESYHNAQRHSTVLLWGKKKLKALLFIIIPYILWKKVRGEKKDTIIGIPVHIHRKYTTILHPRKILHTAGTIINSSVRYVGPGWRLGTRWSSIGKSCTIWPLPYHGPHMF